MSKCFMGLKNHQFLNVGYAQPGNHTSFSRFPVLTCQGRDTIVNTTEYPSHPRKSFIPFYQIPHKVLETSPKGFFISSVTLFLTIFRFLQHIFDQFLLDSNITISSLHTLNENIFHISTQSHTRQLQTFLAT